MSWESLFEQVGVPFDGHASSIDLLRRLRDAEAEVVSGVGTMKFQRAEPVDWTELLLGKSESARRHWACLAAGLDRLGTFDGSPVYLDLLEDDSGAHRVYGMEPAMHRLARDGDDLLDALATGVWSVDDEDDAWRGAPRSAERVVLLLERLHPAGMFLSHRTRQWPKPPKRPKFAGLGPAWIRGVMVFVLAAFQRDKKVALPDLNEFVDDWGNVPDLGGALLPVQHDLLTRLEDLERAIVLDDVPERVALLALSDDDEIAHAAQRWMADFDDARTRPIQSTTQPDHQASNADVRKALRRAVDALVTKELLELEPKGAEELEDELTSTFFKVVALAETSGTGMKRSAVIGSLIHTMIESDHVVDVYGDDDTLAQVVAAALGA